MRKIDSNQEDPIDNVFIVACELIAPYFHQLSWTPNMITTLGNVFGLISWYFLWKKQVFLFAFFFLMRYWMDCLDGFYARTYKMYSKLGDMYDHISDLINIGVIFTLIYVFYWKQIRQHRWFKWMFGLFVFSGIMILVHLGCQQRWTNSVFGEESLDILMKLCPNKDWIVYTRYFGCGVFNLLFIGFLLLLSSGKNERKMKSK